MRFLRILKPALCLSVAAFALGGCIREDRDDCPPESVHFMVKAYAESGAEVTEDEVRDVILYVFDGELHFVERIETELGTLVEVRPPADGQINIIAWGNLGGGNQTVPVLLPGDNKNTALVRLLEDTRATATPHHPCDDLFFGEVSVSDIRQEGNVLIPMHRKAGSMTVSVRKLKEYTGFADDDFSVVVRETFNSIDFDGNCIGSMASYRPSCAFATDGVLKIPIFNMIPGTGLSIDLYHGQDLIYTASVSGGEPIDVIAGKLTNVLIDFTGNISVSVTVTSWGQQQVWKDF